VALATLVAGCAGDDEKVDGQGEAAPDATIDAAAADPNDPDFEPAPTSAPSIDDLLAEDRPLVIAHTGALKDAPQATLFAFQAAVDNGADMLEMDLQLTADGHLVALHDDTVDRVTEGTGAIGEMTLAEAQALDKGYWFAPDCGTCPDEPDENYPYRGVRTGDVDPPEGFGSDDFSIATLAEIHERFPHMPLDLEIKAGDRALEAASALAAELDRMDREDSVVVVSFDDEVVNAFQSLAPEVETSPGVAGMFEFVAGVPMTDHRIIQIPPSFEGVDLLTPEIFGAAVDQGLIVWVWMNDRDQEQESYYRSLLELGVDGIRVDHTAQAVAARDS
jgi:glycerophosphoryl diester phosphodiesterase